MPRVTAILRAGEIKTGAIVDTLILPFAQRQFPQGSFEGLRGTAVENNLPGSAVLQTDDCLQIEDGTLIEIVAATEPLLEIRAPDQASLARIAFHLGDRHVPVEITDRKLRVRNDAQNQKLLAQMGVAAASIEAPFMPEGGAYAHQTHGHDHPHDHEHHDHDHAHCSHDHHHR